MRAAAAPGGGTDGVTEGRARLGVFPAAARGSGGTCGGAGDVVVSSFPERASLAAQGPRHAGKATGRARCEGGAPVPHGAAQSAVATHNQPQRKVQRSGTALCSPFWQRVGWMMPRGPFQA